MRGRADTHHGRLLVETDLFLQSLVIMIATFNGVICLSLHDSLVLGHGDLLLPHLLHTDLGGHGLAWGHCAALPHQEGLLRHPESVPVAGQQPVPRHCGQVPFDSCGVFLPLRLGADEVGASPRGLCLIILLGKDVLGGTTELLNKTVEEVPLPAIISG